MEDTTGKQVFDERQAQCPTNASLVEALQQPALPETKVSRRQFFVLEHEVERVEGALQIRAVEKRAQSCVSVNRDL
jgi:hypothetical protein